MLVTKIIKVPNKGQHICYRNIGIINNDTIEFDIIHLKPSSSIIIDVICDICLKQIKTPYGLYLKNIKKYNFYSCNGKCSNIKKKKTCLENYGVDNPSKVKEIREKANKTNFEKYGVENVSKNEKILEKVKKTNLKKYGVEYASQHIDIKEKTKQTNLEKYGVENYTQTKEYLKKTKQTNLEKYGVENISNSKEIRDKAENTNLEKYGTKYASQNEDIKKKTKQNNLEKYGEFHYMMTNKAKKLFKENNLEKYGVDNYKKCEEYRKNTIIGQHPNYIKYIDNSNSLFNCDLNKNHQFKIHIDNFYSRIKQNIPLCTICYPIGDNKSIKEKILLEYIRSIYSGEVISGYKDSLEIDIYLPEIKIGIEFNGLYWHSNKFKENNYHINKLNFFKEKGIDIKMIYEDDFDINLPIIKSQINNWLGLTQNKIYARKTEVKQVTNTEEYRNFLNQNHIQGFVASKLVYGLYHQDNLVSLMCFDKKEGRLNMEEGEWNLSRFCNLLNHQIVGGASKLLNHFIKINRPSRIISYADKDWSNGNLYFTLGFRLLSESKPDYKYIVDGLRKSKQNFTKAKLQKLGHDISLTESQIMENLNINKIYDCGKMKFELLIKK